MANEKLDVIDRKALLAKYDRVHIGEPGKARKLIEEAPSVEAVPVVHGRWHKPTPCSQEFCTNCGLTPKTNFGWLPPYCPNCGAKMDGDGNVV